MSKKKRIKRYHRDIFFPPWYDPALEKFLATIRSTSAIVFSLHAVEKTIAYSFRFGQELQKYLMKIIRKQLLNSSNVFEFYAVDEEIRKACFRVSFEQFPVDLALVVSADGTVITVFVVNKHDNHNSLDKTLYERS